MLLDPFHHSQWVISPGLALEMYRGIYTGFGKVLGERQDTCTSLQEKAHLGPCRGAGRRHLQSASSPCKGPYPRHWVCVCCGGSGTGIPRGCEDTGTRVPRGLPASKCLSCCNKTTFSPVPGRSAPPTHPFSLFFFTQG